MKHVHHRVTALAAVAFLALGSIGCDAARSTLGLSLPTVEQQAEIAKSPALAWREAKVLYDAALTGVLTWAQSRQAQKGGLDAGDARIVRKAQEIEREARKILDAGDAAFATSDDDALLTAVERLRSAATALNGLRPQEGAKASGERPARAGRAPLRLAHHEDKPICRPDTGCDALRRARYRG